MIVDNTKRHNYYIVSTPLGIRHEMYLPIKPDCKGPYIFEPGDEYYSSVLDDFNDIIRFNLKEVNLEYINKFTNSLQRVYE